ncbi:MAG: 4Fe-4S binding protein [Kiritimatiellia bacterium]
MRKLRYLRVALATLSLLALTATFLDFTGTAAGWFGWAAKIQLWPSALALSLATVIAILACTLLLGRVYCSVVCPLGIFQDVLIFLRRLFGFKFAVSAEAKPARLTRESVRIALAAVFFGGGFLGLHFQWLEPYAIYGRAASTLFAPLYRMGNNVLAQWAERHASYAFHAVEVVAPPLAVVVAAAGTLALVSALALWKGRLWCNAVCPVGTLLGYTAKVSLLKPRIDASKCVKCGLCARVCKAGCIDVATGTIDRSKCVACFDCGAVCGKGALTWSR